MGSPLKFTPSSLNVQYAQAANSALFQFYSNGGYGRLPNPVDEDQITTDKYVARRVTYPSFSLEKYYTQDNKMSIHNTFNQNRALTMAQSFDQLQQQGVRLIGQEREGQYSIMASTPDPSNTVSTYSTDQETHILFWMILIIGGIALISNAMAEP